MLMEQMTSRKIPGSGSGTSAKSPALVVADVENPAELHKTLVP